jgi:hypothetical protein
MFQMPCAQLLAGRLSSVLCSALTLSAWLRLGAAGWLANAAAAGLSGGCGGRLAGRGSTGTATAKLANLLTRIPANREKNMVNFFCINKIDNQEAIWKII